MVTRQFPRRYSHISPLGVQRYDTILPNAFDESLSILEKINKIIEHLRLIIENTNGINDDFNLLLQRFEELKEWVVNVALPESLIEILNEWLDSGKLEEILSDKVLGMKADKTTVRDIAINPIELGAVGDGVNDDTDFVEQAINGYKRILLEGDFLITRPIEVPSGRLIFSTKGQVTIGEGGFSPFIVKGSNVTFDGVKILGAWGNNYQSNETLIKVSGVDNGPNTEPTFIENIQIINCVLNNARRSAVHSQYVRRLYVNNNDIQNMGYCGVEVQSCEHVNVNNNEIHNIVPGAPVGSGVNAYAVYFSQVNSADTVRHPACNNCEASYNNISNINWEGLDTHGGYNISFTHNTITNTSVGIAIINSDDENGVTLDGSKKVTISYNRVFDCIFGVALSRVTTSKFHEDITIDNNQFERCGNVSSGAGVAVGYTRNVNINNNVFNACLYLGINFRGYVYNSSVNGNVFNDIHTNSPTNTVLSTAIFVSEEVAFITMTGNSLQTSGRISATKLNQYGFRMLPDISTYGISVGNNNFSQATEQAFGITATQSRKISAPTHQTNREFIPVDTNVNQIVHDVTLPISYSANTLFDVTASIVRTEGNMVLVEATRTSINTISITVKTIDGQNFNDGTDIIVAWQTTGF